MSTTSEQKLRFDCFQDHRLKPADVRLVKGVLEIACTNPFDSIEISYTFDDGLIEKVLVCVCDADGDVIKECDYNIEDVDWIVVEAEEGLDPIINHTPVNLNDCSSVDCCQEVEGVQTGLAIRRRLSLSEQRR